jgi:hypothetical protein
MSTVPADIGWAPYLRGRAIRAIWHSRWGPIGITSVYGVVNNVDDNMDLVGLVLKDSLSLGCQAMIGGDFNARFSYMKHGVGPISSCLTHLDFGPTCFSSGCEASSIDYMLISKELGWVGGSTETRDSVLATHRPLVWNMGTILAQKEMGEVLIAKKHKGLETKDIREMDKMKGKKGFVELVDRKGGKVSWEKVEGNINRLIADWKIGGQDEEAFEEGPVASWGGLGRLEGEAPEGFSVSRSGRRVG